MNKKLIAAAVATAFSLGLGITANAAPKQKMETCYGIAKAGKNACGTPTHSCAGQAKTDNDPNEWILVPAGTCVKKGGTTEASSTAKSSAVETPKQAIHHHKHTLVSKKSEESAQQ